MEEPTRKHAARIAEELKQAGVSAYGKQKFAAKYLPKVIHENERIKAVLYGRYHDAPGGGFMSYAAGMLVATDARILFLDHKPGFTAMDELTYDIVTGIGVSKAGIGATVTLHTRIGDYAIHFANPDGIRNFVEYIEGRRLDTSEAGSYAVPSPPVSPPVAPIKSVVEGLDEQAITFLRKHEIGVLSTIDRMGNPHGAAIYYRIDSQNSIYMITKASTQKARDMFTNQQVAFTVFDAHTAETVQLSGQAEVVNNPGERQQLIKLFTQPRQYDDDVLPPPITTIHEDAYVAMRIVVTEARYTNYKARAKN